MSARYPGRGDHGVGRDGQDLDPLPPQDAILAVMGTEWQSAEQLARELGVEGSRRLGMRASKGNWSGEMKAGVRLSHRLLAMHRAKLIEAREPLDWDRSARWEFRAPQGEVTVHRNAVVAKRPKYTGGGRRKPLKRPQQ